MNISRARWVRPVAFAAAALIAVGCGASQANGKGGDDAGDVSIVAKIGDTIITNAELDKELRAKDGKAFQAYYDARKKVLDLMITKHVIDAELAKRGITESELQAEITGGAAAVGEADVQAFYAQNKAQMGGRPLEEVGPQIVQYLTNQRLSTVMGDFVSNLKQQANVSIMLDPPRSEVKIAADDPRKGAEGAPITLVEFSDFQ